MCYVNKSGKFLFLVAVLEKVVNLGEGQEVDRLVKNAQGRRLFGQVRKTAVLQIPQGDNTCKCLNFSSEYANLLSKVVQTLTGIRGGRRMVGKVKATLTDSEALPQTESFQQILLAILCLDFPKQISELANELNIPLLGFQTHKELVSYLEAVIRSGISEEEKSGTVFFMGNTEHWVLSSAGNQCCHPSLGIIDL